MSIRSYKKSSEDSLLERLRKKDLQNHPTFNCTDAAYTNLTVALQNIVNETAPKEDIRVKLNSKP